MVGPFPCAQGLCSSSPARGAPVPPSSIKQTYGPCFLLPARGSDCSLDSGARGMLLKEEDSRRSHCTLCRQDFSVSLGKSNAESLYSWGGGVPLTSHQPPRHPLPSTLGVSTEAGVCVGGAGRSRALHSRSQICWEIQHGHQAKISFAEDQVCHSQKQDLGFMGSPD